MSRLAKSPILLPKGVEVKAAKGSVEVKGPKGTMKREFPEGISVDVQEGQIIVNYDEKSGLNKPMHGLHWSLINNAVIGSIKGYEKILELVGVGYRAALKGNQLNLQLGYSHDINFDIPEGIKIAVEKQTTLKISGFDKQLVGSVASKIKTLRKIEPYKGKGIREKGQYILKKEGKKK